MDIIDFILNIDYGQNILNLPITIFEHVKRTTIVHSLIAKYSKALSQALTNEDDFPCNTKFCSLCEKLLFKFLHEHNFDTKIKDEENQRTILMQVKKKIMFFYYYKITP